MRESKVMPLTVASARSRFMGVQRCELKAKTGFYALGRKGQA
jgi:hypothetical protein